MIWVEMFEVPGRLVDDQVDVNVDGPCCGEVTIRLAEGHDAIERSVNQHHPRIDWQQLNG